MKVWVSSECLRNTRGIAGDGVFVLCRGEPEKLWTIATGLLPKWVRDSSDKVPQEVSSEGSVKSTPRENSILAVKSAGRRRETEGDRNR